MKIYMKDGLRVTLNAKDPETLEADFGFREGYVQINQWDAGHKTMKALMTISKENLIFIEYDKDEEDQVEMIFDDHWE